MTTHWFQIDANELPAGLIVVDATTEATPLWYGPVVSVLEDLAAQFEGRPAPEVAFLGGSQRHPLADVLRGIDPTGRPAGPATPIGPNLGRGPVIGPVLRWVSTAPPRPVLLVTAVRPLDLDDWAVPGGPGPLAVYRLTGDARLSPPLVTEWGTDADLGLVADFLRDPAVHVECGGSGVPVAWDADGWRWERGRLVFAGASPGRVRLAMLSPTPPRATAVRRSGAPVELEVTGCAPLLDPPPVRLSPAEDSVIDLWRQGAAFWCGACTRSHPPGRVRCEATAGGALLPTLVALPAGTVCVLRREGAGWSASPSRNGVLPAADDRVIVWAAGPPAAFDRQGDEWVPGEVITSEFVPIAGGYVVRV